MGIKAIITNPSFNFYILQNLRLFERNSGRSMFSTTVEGYS